MIFFFFRSSFVFVSSPSIFISFLTGSDSRITFVIPFFFFYINVISAGNTAWSRCAMAILLFLYYFVFIFISFFSLLRYYYQIKLRNERSNLHLNYRYNHGPIHGTIEATPTLGCRGQKGAEGCTTQPQAVQNDHYHWMMQIWWIVY